MIPSFFVESKEGLTLIFYIYMGSKTFYGLKNFILIFYWISVSEKMNIFWGYEDFCELSGNCEV